MTVKIMIGDALGQLGELPDESVHCVVTSPPYWGLRAYKGDPGMIGMEATFAEHLDNLVAVFREVRRVLRKDGTCWLNYGDAYARGEGRGGSGSGDKQASNAGSADVQPRGFLKPKDLMLLPARVAMALQADGWLLRSMIPQIKTNPMPESVADRPTNAVEYWFLFSKSGRTLFWVHRDSGATMIIKPPPDYFWRNKVTGQETDIEPMRWRATVEGHNKPVWSRINKWRGWNYFYDQEAVKEPVSETANARVAKNNSIEARKARANPDASHTPNAERRGINPQKSRSTPPSHQGHEATSHQTLDDPGCDQPATRNMRNWIMAATSPFRGTHFATFAPHTIIPWIKAGTSEKGVCAECGAPWVREVATEWSPTCACDAPAVPATVLDPFAGSGTVGLVADREVRDAILIEISPEYAAMARKRIADDAATRTLDMFAPAATNPLFED